MYPITMKHLLKQKSWLLTLFFHPVVSEMEVGDLRSRDRNPASAFKIATMPMQVVLSVVFADVG